MNAEGGLPIGNMGYTWFFEERLAMEILIGLTWPSLYPKPGMPDDLYASPFFGLGLSFVLCDRRLNYPSLFPRFIGS